jgi:DNA-binding PadR family transcriptional regulator
VTRKTPQPMTSPVNWALLGLIIERESYAYALAQRFQRVYRNVISLSSTSHVYTALGVLQERSFVEQVPGTRPGRQPKPSYRATALGVQSYGEWLVSYVHEDRRRQVMFVLGLSALAGSPAAVRDILDRYEQAWLEHDGTTGIFAIDGVADGPGVELVERILFEENELTAAAKRSWVRHARTALEGLTANASEQVT